MNAWKLALAALIFYVPVAYAGDRPHAFDVHFNDTGECKSLSIGFTVLSQHTAKGDRNGRLNERNHGKVAECFFDTGRHFYSITGALENSQWGPTLLHGYGARIRSPQFWRFSGELGYEVAMVYYEQGCPSRGPYANIVCSASKRSIVAPLPMYYVGVATELPSMRQVLAPFLTYEERVALPGFMQRSIGEFTIGRRTLGGGIITGKEKIHLWNATVTYRF